MKYFYLQQYILSTEVNDNTTLRHIVSAAFQKVSRTNFERVTKMEP